MLDRPWLRFTGVEAALIIGGITAAASAGIAYEGAQRQNKAVKRSIEAENKRSQVGSKQVNQAAALEAEKNRAQAARIRGLLRVNAAEQGGEGGSFDALIRQTSQDESLNLSILEENRKNQLAAVLSGSEANLAALQGRLTNPLLDSTIAGLQGFSTGLQIGGAANELGDSGNAGRSAPSGRSYSGFGNGGGNSYA